MENKVIFESDSIFRMTLLQMIPFEFVSIIPEQFIHKCRDKANEYNLIRKSAVEEAEEVYQLWLKNEFDGINLIHKQRNAIQELKAENERLKG